MFVAALNGAVGGLIDAGSLGIGIDVPHEAFAFAAKRSGYGLEPPW